ncbi:MAG TPA: heavy metal translocating P-type ATPase, partial [Verrucomicrobiae bacterium]|nr:heavy metal translocating P-type ATPase [Verrucomicrobiae bacterium]
MSATRPGDPPATTPPKANPGESSRFIVTGMTCGNCARHVREAMEGVPGVASVMVDLGGKTALARWVAGAVPDEAAVAKAVVEAGYEAEPVHEQGGAGQGHSHDDEHGHGKNEWQLNLWLGLAVTAVLMTAEWGFGAGTSRSFQWVAFVLSTLVQVIGGAQFYRGAWNQLKRGASNMDTLVALGSTAAYTYSVWGLLTGAHGHLYFMEASSIITLISLGHWVESRVGTKAAAALKALLNLAPATARKLEPAGMEREVPVSELRPEDRVVLRPGDRVAVDAEVTEGESAVDESMLTGESLPVEKRAGTKLYAGTLNQSGRLVARVTGTGEATALAQIIAVVERAQGSRANIQRLADRVSNVFVPIVVAIALATALVWGFFPDAARAASHWLGKFLWAAHSPDGIWAAAIIQATAVLIVACPCAMGLATPAAIMAGANAAARRGVLIRDGVALEKSGAITAVLFDKTGTLTMGQVTAAEVWVAPSFSEVDAVSVVGALASGSNHPLSQAVAAWAKDRAKEGGTTRAIFNWEELRGRGVTAKFTDSQDGTEAFRLGSLEWLAESGAEAGVEGVAEFVKRFTAQGATVIGLARDHHLVAAFALRDELKPAANEVIRELKGQGLKAYLVTGDRHETAAAIAERAGIPAVNVFAGVRPEQKAEIVQKLQACGERVAFIGDGINDAP